MKPLAWVASSKDDLCDFPDDARREAGYQLHKVQSGEQPSDFKPMHVSNRQITPSDGNVFSDLGFEDSEAENLRIRAQLMAPLEQYVRTNELTQEEAADQLGTTQARISLLTRGKIQEFSIDALITMLDRIDLQVSVDVRPRSTVG